MELAARAEREIDLVVADIVMLQMNGDTLAKQLVASHPGLPVLYVSGNGQHNRARA